MRLTRAVMQHVMQTWSLNRLILRFFFGLLLHRAGTSHTRMCFPVCFYISQAPSQPRVGRAVSLPLSLALVPSPPFPAHRAAALRQVSWRKELLMSEREEKVGVVVERVLLLAVPTATHNTLFPPFLLCFLPHYRHQGCSGFALVVVCFRTLLLSTLKKKGCFAFLHLGLAPPQ